MLSVNSNLGRFIEINNKNKLKQLITTGGKVTLFISYRCPRPRENYPNHHSWL